MSVELNVGDVFRTTSEVIQKNLGTFFALVVVIAIPNLVMQLGSDLVITSMIPDMIPAPGAVPDVNTMMQNFAVFVPLILLSIVVVMITYVVAQAGMTFTAIEHMSGRTADVGSALGAAFRALGSLLVGGLLVGLVTGLGTLMCIVPGIFAALFFCLTTPAILAERLGPIAGMERSAQLTDGHKLNIFLVFLALFGLAIVISMCVLGPIAGLAALGTSSAGGATAFANPLGPVQVLVKLVSVVINGALSAFGTTTVAVIYAKIRGLREGMDAAAYASVFS